MTYNFNKFLRAVRRVLMKTVKMRLEDLPVIALEVFYDATVQTSVEFEQMVDRCVSFLVESFTFEFR